LRAATIRAQKAAWSEEWTVLPIPRAEIVIARGKLIPRRDYPKKG
jgi:hypothetical protein